MKNTYIISALVLSLALGLAGSNIAMAQEYITTQSAELNQAIAKAEAARTQARMAGEQGSMRGKQIENYIDGMLEKAYDNNYANSAELTRALNDAALSTSLLLGTTQTNNKAAARSNSNSTVATTTEPQAVSAPAAQAEEAPVAVAQETVPQTTVATTIKLEVPATTANNTDTTLPVDAKATTPEENKIVLATAQIDTENTTVDDATADNNVEVPATGEVKDNTIGKIIATSVAAVIAFAGAVMIVKRVKKNA